MKLETQLRWNFVLLLVAAAAGTVSAAMGVSKTHTLANALAIVACSSGLLGAWRSLMLGRRTAGDLNALAERGDALARGDFSGQALVVDKTAELEHLAETVNGLQLRLREVTGAFSTAATTLASNAKEMRVSGDGMHQRMDEQSQQTQQAAAAMTEMSASIAEVSRHTQDAAGSARDAAKTARDGGEIVRGILGDMDLQWERVNSTATVIEALNADAGKISRIVNVIEDIAKKTNLLALNAAIEAARAGEQGRGFAVVAGEVRRLAENTAKATGEIAAMIGNVQQRSSEAWTEVDRGRSGVAALMTTTKQAGASLEGIIGMAERVDRMIAQIAIATAQQAAVADQSSASLDAIHALSGENLCEMATTAQGIESLRSAALGMRQQVEGLFTGRADSRPGGTLRGRNQGVPVSVAGWGTA
jgi:methyl-accepting chemotaxis protein